jgi:cytochrome c2
VRIDMPRAEMALGGRRMSSHCPTRFAATGLAILTVCLLGAGCGSGPRHGPANGAGVSSTDGSPVARGKVLYQADGCVACHSLNGTRLTGPTWKGLAGSKVKLDGNRTVIASDAYLAKHITEPNALTVEGYPGEVMAEAIETLDLKKKPSDVRALVAFVDSLR